MNKAIELYKIYKKNSFPDINDNIEKFHDEVKQIGLEIEKGDYAPFIENVIDIQKGKVEKYSFEFKRESYWEFVEKNIIYNEGKPAVTKIRKVGKLYFWYNSHFNVIDRPKLELIDSNIWDVVVDGGDGDNFKCKEIDGYYITNDGIYTELNFDYYMDFVTTDGALYTSVKLKNNLMIDSIRQAMLEDDEKRIETLVQEGKDINEKDERGRTSLMIAAQRLDFKMIKVLLQLGADKNITDNEGKTALNYLNDMEKYVSEKKKVAFEEVKQLLQS